MIDKIDTSKLNKELCNKDYGLSLFHAIGKFLYNKRLLPGEQKPQSVSSIRMKKKPRPRFYENHLEILNQVQTDSSTFSLFVHENMLDHFDDIADWANVLTTYSWNDAMLNRNSYAYWNMQYMDELQQLATHIEWLAITEYNIHGGDIVKRSKKTMAKPVYFESKRKQNENKQILYDSLKIEQCLK